MHWIDLYFSLENILHVSSLFHSSLQHDFRGVNPNVYNKTWEGRPKLIQDPEGHHMCPTVMKVSWHHGLQLSVLQWNDGNFLCRCILYHPWTRASQPVNFDYPSSETILLSFKDKRGKIMMLWHPPSLSSHRHLHKFSQSLSCFWIFV